MKGTTVEINDGKEPPVDEPIVVSYGKQECLAYYDQHGKWRNWYSDKEIENVRDWIALEY